MSGFLERVLREKAAEVALKKRDLPLAELGRRARAVPVRDFRAAVSGGGRIIAEIKRRSPSVPAFRQQGDAPELAAAYAAAGAAGISVVVDTQNFGTGLDDLARVRWRVLAKDFFVEEYQLAEARAAGADALLLIVAILSDAALRELLDCAADLGAAALVECHDEGELERALAAGAGIVGINNRNLDTMTVSVETSRRLAARVPEGVVCVAESGIDSRETIEDLTRAGVDAFLIGSALLDADDPGRKLKELRGDSS